VIRPIIRHGLKVANEVARNSQRIAELALFQQDHGTSDCIDPCDVGTPVIELYPIFFAPGVLLYELDQAEDVRRVTFYARPFLKPKKNEQAMMIQYALIEKLGAIFGAEIESN
jgi:hypothetical protein